MARARLGDLLVNAGLLSQDRLEYALREQKRTGVRLGRILVDHGIVNESAMYDALARASGVERLNFQEVAVEPDAANRVKGEWALEHGVIPFRFDEQARNLFVAITDPTNVDVLDELSFRAGCRVTTVLGSETEVHRLIRHHFYREPLDRTIDRGLGATSERVTFDASAIVHGIDAVRNQLHATGVSGPPQAQHPGQEAEPEADREALLLLKPLFDAQQETARALQAMFQLCLNRGIIGYEEYLARLNSISDEDL